MSRIVMVLAGVAAFSLAAEGRLSAQSAAATLAVSASVKKNCTITTTAVTFGDHDSVVANSTAPLDGVGAVVVTCTKGAPAKVGLNAGSKAEGTTRRMSQGAADFLTYELREEDSH